jgi:hypothetical protein
MNTSPTQPGVCGGLPELSGGTPLVLWKERVPPPGPGPRGDLPGNALCSTLAA